MSIETKVVIDAGEYMQPASTVPPGKLVYLPCGEVGIKLPCACDDHNVRFATNPIRYAFYRFSDKELTMYSPATRMREFIGNVAIVQENNDAS